MAYNLILVGSSGRLGAAILAQAQKDPAFDWIAQVERESSSAFEENLKRASVIVDASLPEYAMGYLQRSEAAGRPLPYVIGCTGWDREKLASLKTIAEKRPILLAPNFSLGTALLTETVGLVASKLKDFGFSISIEETHHVHKKDSPSGTAKQLAEKVEGVIGKPAPITSKREGEVIGLHRVDFKSTGETLTFQHDAHSREIFAIGAVAAAKWLAAQRKPGMYSMRDVLFSN